MTGHDRYLPVSQYALPGAEALQDKLASIITDMLRKKGWKN
jgi:hypothetical protein